MVLARNIFAFHGIAHTEEELELHLMGLYLFKQKPTKERVRSLRAWFDRLLMINTERNLFPRDASGTVVGAALWTLPYKLLCGPMDDDAAHAVGRAARARAVELGRPVPGAAHSGQGGIRRDPALFPHPPQGP